MAPSITFFVTFALLFGLGSGALFAIDLGSEYVKVALIKPGRVPISIVQNELSKRKTVAAVAFQSTTRLYGEDALSLITRKPEKVLLRIRDFLGRNTSDPFLEELNGADSKWKPPYLYKNDSRSIRFDLGEDESITAVEVLVYFPRFMTLHLFSGEFAFLSEGNHKQ